MTSNLPTEIWPPAKIGDHVSEVDTPALLIDLDAFEANLATLEKKTRNKNIAVRPHAKSHKCPEIAKKQIELGAVGICCQKLAEAEIMAAYGVTNILISNQIVTPKKIKRLCQLSTKISLSVLVDHKKNVEDLETACATTETQLDLLIEINVGANRCGVDSPSSALELAKLIKEKPHLNLIGIHAYQGAAQHERSFSRRAELSNESAKIASSAKDLMSEHGIKIEYVTGGGTGTFMNEVNSGVYTEIQPGSYIFMDADYQRNKDQDEGFVSEFQNSLFILTTVMSYNHEGRPIVDAGLKSLSIDSGMPTLFDAEAKYQSASDEHGVLVAKRGHDFYLGKTVKLVPGHCDPTVNLYDWFVCIRNDRVENVWPISARGASI